MEVTRQSTMTTPIMIDEKSLLRVLHPDLQAKSKCVQNTSTEFRSKIAQFNNAVKQLLGPVNEQATMIEKVKLQAIGARNMVSTEVETRRAKLQDQENLIGDKQEQLERLKTELKSLVMVKQEQEVLIAKLSESSGCLRSFG